jgi:hypothetical protein
MGRATHIDDDDEIPIESEGAETGAEPPRGLLVESGEDEGTFLKGDAGDIVSRRHR